MAFGYTPAQNVITVTANDLEISDNLDLQAVASVFGDSRDLEDFEYRLNDPNTQISNLDLNRDGYVDYLRVIELSENNTHLIVIQSVLGRDLYQDVATLEVERDSYGGTTIQVVGDTYIYGPHYIIEPVYIYRPLIVMWFWGPYYRPWHSPYYWSCYPHYFRPWHPYRPHVYRTNVYAHINIYNTYHYTNVRKSGSAFNMYHSVQRNDYGNMHPENSFAMRHKGITNRNELTRYGNLSAMNNHRQARPARTSDSRDYRSQKTSTGTNSSKQVSTNRTSVIIEKPTRNEAVKGTTKKSNGIEKKPVQSKKEIKTTRPQMQRETVSNASKHYDTRQSNSGNGQKSKSSNQYSGKPVSKNSKTPTTDRKSTLKKSSPQTDTKTEKRTTNVKSRVERN